MHCQMGGFKDFSDCYVNREVRTSSVGSASGLKRIDISEPKVFLFTFPLKESTAESTPARLADTTLVDVCSKLHPDSTICVLASAGEAAILTASLSKVLEFRHWIVVKTATQRDTTVPNALPNQHSALIVFTRYPGPLKHTKTRIKYETCDACGKTTKDYGGKRHLYHDYGTSISDVWRDIEWNPQVGTRVITQRLRDLFGLHPYKELRVH
jgi:site-specific DNA-methyltransferase (adenine-specific)